MTSKLSGTMRTYQFKNNTFLVLKNKILCVLIYLFVFFNKMNLVLLFFYGFAYVSKICSLFLHHRKLRISVCNAKRV